MTTIEVDRDGPQDIAKPKSGPIAAVGGWDRNGTRLLNRELSWLAFNARVLHLACDPDIPLLERARFLAIFDRNLDEFFQVRVSRLLDQVAAGITARTHDGRTSRQVLAAIREAVVRLGGAHQDAYLDLVRPALADAGISLVDYSELTGGERGRLAEHFRRRIFCVLTPLAVDPGHPFPYISDLSLNLAVLVEDGSDGQRHFARVKVPNTLSRWVRVGSLDPKDPEHKKHHKHKHRKPQRERFVPLEQVIAAHLDQLFRGMVIVEHHTFRVTRNVDLAIEEEADDLLAAVEYELRRRRFGRATRLEISSTMSTEVLDLLLRELDLESRDVYTCRAPLDARSLGEIVSVDRPDLRWPRWYGVTEPELRIDGDDPVDFFQTLRRGDVLVHHPYSSFSNSVMEFIHRAAADPKVLAIKLTLYRTAGDDSPIIDALIGAAERGKQVAVLVEVKARFDEAANIGWARRLERAGVHVTHGLVGLKIHTKIAMVVREEADGIRRYCHIGTGNYNHRTARVYEDLGLLTSAPEVGEDLAALFNYLTGYGRDIVYDRLLVAPDGLRRGLVELIDSEIAAEQGRIVMKMNALVDEMMINKLYEASAAGVEIDVIVRGICALRPQVPGLSERIRVRSIVGRYLEHSRLFHFANGDGPARPRMLIGSADVMSRNLNRRVEALVRIDDPRLQQRLYEILEIELADDRLAWTLDGGGVWSLFRGPDGIDSHVRLQQLASARSRV